VIDTSSAIDAVLTTTAAGEAAAVPKPGSHRCSRPRLAAAACSDTICVAAKQLCGRCCNKITDAEAAVSVNEKKWLVMHMHVQLQLDELRGPQTLWPLYGSLVCLQLLC
jgi:hypothetical protein